MDDIAAYPLIDPPSAALDNRRFTAAIVAALTLHAIIVLPGLFIPAPRQMGEESGSPEGLTVEIVDANEMPGHSAPAMPASALAAEAAPLPKPEIPAPEASAIAPSAPAAEATAEPEVPAVPAPPTLKPSAHEETPAPAPAKPPPIALDSLDPSLFKIQPKSEAQPETPSSKSGAKGHAPNNPAQPAKAASQAKPPQISMTMPAPSFASSVQLQGRDASVSRPEGITRSGLNDEFGRGVIRALRQTMPPNRQIARATVRFVLSPDGNLVEVQLVASSGDPLLDQNVVFAVKQANFPIPATNLTALDRQFRVTYVYH